MTLSTLVPGHEKQEATEWMPHTPPKDAQLPIVSVSILSVLVVSVQMLPKCASKKHRPSQLATLGFPTVTVLVVLVDVVDVLVLVVVLVVVVNCAELTGLHFFGSHWHPRKSGSIQLAFFCFFAEKGNHTWKTVAFFSCHFVGGGKPPFLVADHSCIHVFPHIYLFGRLIQRSLPVMPFLLYPIFQRVHSIYKAHPGSLNRGLRATSKSASLSNETHHL